jgi:hypothetical protein
MDCEWFDVSPAEAELLEDHGFEVHCVYHEHKAGVDYCVIAEPHEVAKVIAILS